MSDYPTFDQLIGTRFVPFDNTNLQRSPGGKKRVQAAFQSSAGPSPRSRIGEFVVVHEVDSTDRAALLAHFTANRRNSFNFVEQARPTIVWTCLWGPTRPQFTRSGTLSTEWLARSMLIAITNDE